MHCCWCWRDGAHDRCGKCVVKLESVEWETLTECSPLFSTPFRRSEIDKIERVITRNTRQRSVVT